MKKLRLIKPWHLQAVRQKAGSGREAMAGMVINLAVPCCAPRQTDTEPCSLRGEAGPRHLSGPMAAPAGMAFTAEQNPRS